MYIFRESIEGPFNVCVQVCVCVVCVCVCMVCASDKNL